MKNQIVLLLHLFLLSNLSFAQFTSKDLNKLYQKNSTDGLEKIFSEWNGLRDNYDSIIVNDTLKQILSIYKDVILLKKSDYGYLILQKDFPKVKINNTDFKIEIPFAFQKDLGFFKTLNYNIQNINAIKSFVGDFPSDNRQYNFLGRKKRKYKEYEKRLKFIGKYLKLPYTRGRSTGELVPYKLESIQFTDDFNQATIKHEIDYYGETAIFVKENGKWIKKKDITIWIE